MKHLLRGVAVSAIAICLTSCGSSGGSNSAVLPVNSTEPKSITTATPSPAASPTPVPTPPASPTPLPQTITSADEHLQPTLVCIGHRPWDGRYYLRFGYNSTESSAVQIAIDGVDGTTQMNHVVVTPANGNAPYEFNGQPVVFLTGWGNTGFDVSVDQKDIVTWYLDGNALTATTNGAVQCP